MPLPSNTNCRIPWLDYAKAIGIILVVYGHLCGEKAPFTLDRNAIYLFHMPLFFFLSGFLYRDRGVVDNIVKGVKSLLIPALAWNIVFLSLHSGRAALLDWRLPCGVTWFLVADFYCKVIFGFFLKRKSVAFAILGCGLIFVFARNFETLYMRSAIMALPLYTIGYVAKLYQEEIKSVYAHSPVTLIRLMIIACVVTLVSAQAWYGSTSMKYTVFGSHYLSWPMAIFAMYALALMGVFLVCQVACCMGKFKSQLLLTVGQNTLVILCVHYPFCFFVRSYVPTGWIGIVVRIILAILITLLFTGVSILIKSMKLTPLVGSK